MSQENHYSYITEWSQEDECYLARVLEFPSLSAFGDTRVEAEKELEIALSATLSWMKEEGEAIPKPLSHREFKGNIALRVPPSTHRDLVMMAGKEGISLNQYITSLLERNLYHNTMLSLIEKVDRRTLSSYECLREMILSKSKLFETEKYLDEVDDSINTSISNTRLDLGKVYFPNLDDPLKV